MPKILDPQLYTAPQLEHLLLKTVFLLQLEHFLPWPPLPEFGGTVILCPHFVHSRPNEVSKNVGFPHFGQTFPAIINPSLFTYIITYIYIHIHIYPRRLPVNREIINSLHCSRLPSPTQKTMIPIRNQSNALVKNLSDSHNSQSSLALCLRCFCSPCST